MVTTTCMIFISVGARGSVAAIFIDVDGYSTTKECFYIDKYTLMFRSWS